MTFAQIQGNDELKKALAGMISSGKVPHAILFHEDDGGGAFPLCLAFLQRLYCKSVTEDSCGNCPSCNKIAKLIHPDIHFIFPTISGQLSLNYTKEFRALATANPKFTESELVSTLKIEGKNMLISVLEAKQLLNELSLSALEGGYRSVVIYLPEKMNAEAGNKLLKMIEEPPAKTQFLLITHSPEKVLTTISSRCQRLRVQTENSNQIVDFDRKDLFSSLMTALLAKDLMACLEISESLAALPSREVAKAFCNYASINLRNIFIVQQVGNNASLGLFPSECTEWAEQLNKNFARKALSVIDRTLMLINRNVNLKLLFSDMANRLYILV